MTEHTYPSSNRRSVDKVRELDAEALGVVVGGAGTPGSPTQPRGYSSLFIGEDDKILEQVRELLADGFGGVILRGPPGTSKTWYAVQIAKALTGDSPDRVRFVQFHSSWQYEDFVEGFVPLKHGGGFELVKKHLLLISERAMESNAPHVLVIDEISRADPARVFGEALTYIEATHRGKRFSLASGSGAVIPQNLIILGTMNVFDRGVDQVSQALERRFGYVRMDPDPALLVQILQKNGVPAHLQDAIGHFFRFTSNHPNPYCRIGHAYFNSVRDVASLSRLWHHQLRFVFERAFPAGDEDSLDEISRRWTQVLEAGMAPE